MPEGITVIASWQVPSVWIILWIFGAFVGGFTLYYGYKDKAKIAIIIGWILLVGCIVAMFFPATLPRENRYKVLVDESVSLKEFNERFEVMNQDGIAINIRERTPGEILKPNY